MITETKEIDILDFLGREEEVFTLEKNFIDRVKVLGIKEIEPLLEEDVKIMGKLEKYEFLVLLRDLFIQFKSFGDTKILVSDGTCGLCGAHQPKSKWTSIRPIRKVLELKGNNSNEKFHFALLSKEHETLQFKICNGFIPKNGCKGVDFGTISKLVGFGRQRQDKLSGYRKD